MVDVDLQVDRGELVVLLGPNGAGKTTLLRAATGRIKVDTGTVQVTGTDPRTVPEARATLGFVPQEIALYPHLTVRENLATFARMMGVAKQSVTQRVAYGLTLSGLVERAQDRAGSLSGGMQRRLNIAASLMHDPDLLLLDEPTVGIDAVAKERIHELLHQLRNEGLGILLTTHDLEQAQSLADKVVIMTHGHIRAAKAPGALIRDYFRDGKELVVTLSETATEAQQTLLVDAGLSPRHGSATWSACVVEDHFGAAEWSSKLDALGVQCVEVAIREPSLESVFTRMTAE
jgi:ABC-2 type transport system ATP-binding protein